MKETGWILCGVTWPRTNVKEYEAVPVRFPTIEIFTRCGSIIVFRKQLNQSDDLQHDKVSIEVVFNPLTMVWDE